MLNLLDHYLECYGGNKDALALRAEALLARPPAIDGQAADEWTRMADAIEATPLSDEVYFWGENRNRVVAALRLAAAPPAQGWREAIEAAAKAAEQWGDGPLYAPELDGKHPRDSAWKEASRGIALRIRALAPPVEAQGSERMLREALEKIIHTFRTGNETLSAMQMYEIARAALGDSSREAQGSERVMRDALERLDRFWTADMGSPDKASLPITEETKSIWRQIRAALGDSSPATEERYSLWIDPGPKR